MTHLVQNDKKGRKDVDILMYCENIDDKNVLPCVVSCQVIVRNWISQFAIQMFVTSGGCIDYVSESQYMFVESYVYFIWDCRV